MKVELLTLMSLLQAYLQNPRTRRVLNRKPGEKGFSLIELVVVIAVLAVLIVIALPNFQGVTDDAAASAGKKYLDFVAGVSACSLGHRHPKVTRAIRRQSRKYLHVMVYGEFAQAPAVRLCTQLI